MKDKLRVKFTENDLKRLIYWITLKFKEDEFHHQAASAKSDLIGGFFDRWFNRAPEFLIFGGLLKGKKYDVVIDNFLYGQDTKKNAPDIIGLKRDGKTISKFAVFKDGGWKQIDNMPLIEVKTFRNTQSLTAVGETQMDKDHYYVFVESNVKNDYLLNLFKDSVFTKDNFNSLKVSEGFIESDKDKQIIIPKEIKVGEELGYFKLIGIFKGEELKKHSLLVGMDESGKIEKPRYFDSIEKIEELIHKVEEPISEGKFIYDDLYIPFYINFTSKKAKAIIVKRYKGHMIVKVEGKIEINGQEAKDGYFKVKFKNFDRSSKKREYIGDKYLFEHLAEDVTEDLVKRFDKIANA